MSAPLPRPVLTGSKARVVGIANERSIAWAPKGDLAGGLLDCPAEGSARTVDVSCHSFVRMARPAAPLMAGGGTFARRITGETLCVDGGVNIMA